MDGYGALIVPCGFHLLGEQAVEKTGFLLRALLENHLLPVFPLGSGSVSFIVQINEVSFSFASYILLCSVSEPNNVICFPHQSKRSSQWTQTLEK